MDKTILVHSQFVVIGLPIFGEAKLVFNFDSYQITLAEYSQPLQEQSNSPAVIIVVDAAQQVSDELFVKLESYFRDNSPPKITEFDPAAVKGDMFLPSGTEPTLGKWGDDITHEFHSITSRVARLLRWRLGGERGGHNPIITTPHNYCQCSLDSGNIWKPVPRSGIKIGVRSTKAFSLKAFNGETLGPVLSKMGDEPPAHSIWREAWSNLRSNNHKSAVLLAVAGLEFAVKSYLTQLIPTASWLIMNAPSPPVEPILSEFQNFPHTAKLQNGSVVPPQKLLGEIKKIVKIRNDLAHQGKLEQTRERLERFLVSVRDVLYILDTLAGNTWAEDWISEECKEWLKEPPAKKKGE